MRIALVGLVALAACGGETAPPPPITVTFKDFLYVPITLTVGQTAYGTISGATGTSVVFPGGTTTATWTAQDMKYSDGTPILDDLASGSLLVADHATLEITNLVGGVTYFTPHLTNSTGQSILVAIVEGTTIRCVGGFAAGGAGQFGYYTLDGTTQIRIYRAGSNCTGTYQYWDYASVQGYVFGKTGLLLLEATTAP